MFTDAVSSPQWIWFCWADLGFCHNALKESLWGRLKVGRLYGQRFATHRQAMDEVIEYNHRRLHSTLGYVSPMQFEKSWYAAQQLKAS